LLKSVITLIPPLVIAMAGVNPTQVTDNVTQWGREALKVIAIQDITTRAELPPLNINQPPQRPGRHGPPTPKAPSRRTGRGDGVPGINQPPQPPGPHGPPTPKPPGSRTGQGDRKGRPPPPGRG
jgi:hypothetical protein